MIAVCGGSVTGHDKSHASGHAIPYIHYSIRTYIYIFTLFTRHLQPRPPPPPPTPLVYAFEGSTSGVWAYIYLYTCLVVVIVVVIGVLKFKYTPSSHSHTHTRLYCIVIYYYYYYYYNTVSDRCIHHRTVRIIVVVRALCFATSEAIACDQLQRPRTSIYDNIIIL